MKKTLIASAVALATFTTGAFAAVGAGVMDEDVTPISDVASTLAARMDGMPIVYGNIQLAWAYTDEDDSGSNTTGLADNGSTIGIKHSHEVSPGIEAFLKLELEGIRADDKGGRQTVTDVVVDPVTGQLNVEKTDSTGLIDLDEAYIGLRGGFGEVWVGSDDSAYERLIDGISQYYEYAALNNALNYTTGEGNLVQYSSPAFSGVTFNAAFELDSSAETENGDDTGGEYPFQLGLQYAVDGLSLAVAMDSNDGTGAGNTYGVRGAFAIGELELSALYSTTEDVQDNYGLMAIYSMGSNTFAASYELSTPDADVEDRSVITLQAVHSLSDNMYIWTEAYFVTQDEEGFADFNPDNDENSLFEANSEATQLALGAVYIF